MIRVGTLMCVGSGVDQFEALESVVGARAS